MNYILFSVIFRLPLLNKEIVYEKKNGCHARINCLKTLETYRIKTNYIGRGT